MYRSACFLCLPTVLLTLWGGVSYGERPELISMELHAQPLPTIGNSARLLPKESELKSGNAAVVLLRMPWEQTPFMRETLPKVYDAMDLPYDDPAIDEVTDHVSDFVREMKRAAYIRDADWNYPFDEEPLSHMEVPDLQGMRMFAGRVMYLWVGKQVALGNLDKAREGILIQFACGRHVARTPLSVCYLVGQAIAKMGLERLELLIQQPQAKNLYFALADLPDTLGNVDSIIEMEGRMLESSLPSLTETSPPIGDKKWREIRADYFELVNETLIRFQKEPMKSSEEAKLQTQLLTVAKEELTKLKLFSASQMKSMSDEELVMRWVLAHHAKVYRWGQLANSLPIPQAIEKLVEIEKEDQALRQRIGAPVEVFGAIQPAAFIGFHKFDRRVKIVQTIEAIRDYASRNDNALPKTLADMELPIPLDPLTNKPFVYALDGEQASLSYPRIEGVEDKWQDLTLYELHMAETE